MSPESVFINCPFTRDYAPLFEAMTFTVLACGFHPRSALERGDSGEVRMDKILRLIKSSLYSVHDLSATTLDLATGLPRFNMPFELGLTLGLKAAGSRYGHHKVLVLEAHKYTYQKCLSDIAGQDLQAHGGDVRRMIVRVRNWLRTETATILPGPRQIGDAFETFQASLPESCEAMGISLDDLPFAELVALQFTFLQARNEHAATVRFR